MTPCDDELTVHVEPAGAEEITESRSAWKDRIKTRALSELTPPRIGEFGEDLETSFKLMFPPNGIPEEVVTRLAEVRDLLERAERERLSLIELATHHLMLGLKAREGESDGTD